LTANELQRSLTVSGGVIDLKVTVIVHKPSVRHGSLLQVSRFTPQMRHSLTIYGPLGLLLMAAAPTFAHHSVSAEYDVNRKITYAGVITRVEWSNPHIYFYVDVKDANNRLINWAFEGAGPNTLSRLGWMRDTLKVGDRVTVVAFPARDGANVASARKIVLANGHKVLDGLSADGVRR
jgi:hypothetical protein